MTAIKSRPSRRCEIGFSKPPSISLEASIDRRFWTDPAVAQSVKEQRAGASRCFRLPGRMGRFCLSGKAAKRRLGGRVSAAQSKMGVRRAAEVGLDYFDGVCDPMTIDWRHGAPLPVGPIAASPCSAEARVGQCLRLKTRRLTAARPNPQLGSHRSAAETESHLLSAPMPPIGVSLYLKDESTHPTGSLKHRLARSLFLYALCNGWIGPRTPVIESSSGSTAVSEAYFARLLGLPFYRRHAAFDFRTRRFRSVFYGGKSRISSTVRVGLTSKRAARCRVQRPLHGSVHLRRARDRLARQQ